MKELLHLNQMLFVVMSSLFVYFWKLLSFKYVKLRRVPVGKCYAFVCSVELLCTVEMHKCYKYHKWERSVFYKLTQV